MAADNAFLQWVFEYQNSKFRKCLEPSMTCQANAIRAHSIQNKTTMDLLAQDGHVITPRTEVTKEGLEIEFAKLGRNQASTFTGLCNHHDTYLFRTIDANPIDLSDLEHLFLLAYRSVTRELHAVMAGAAKIQGIYQDRVKRGLDPGDGPSQAGLVATQRLVISYQTWLYRNSFFDVALLAQKYASISHDVIKLANQPPAIAVSALLSLDEVQRDDDIVRVCLNVFPASATETAVVFSYAEPDKDLARQALYRVLQSSGDYQKYELSKLILNRTENFIIGPIHFQNWSESKKNKIQTDFIATLFSGFVADHEDLMLF